MRTYLWLFSMALITLACSPMEKELTETLPNRWPQAVTYEIFVQSFADSDGDGIGDIKGMTSKLDYLQGLGVEAVWLMPINPSPSYHKYDVSDYYGIHSDYGTIEDFQAFLEEAHKRNIKVIIDLVINHCSKLHPWFLNALKEDGEYRDYFVWADKAGIEAEGNLLKAKTGDSDNIHQWNEVTGQDELYFSFFWSGMPDLNYDNPRLREEIYQIGNFWLTKIGVDGFRLDAAKHIYPDHRAADNHAFWKEFKTKMEAFKPDVYLVGEVWADLPTQAPFAQGFSALFNFDLAFSIMETVKNGKVVSASIHEHAWKVLDEGSPVTMFNESEKGFKQYNPDFINTTFLTNHDQNRVMSFFGNHEKKARLAASILMTLPGAPYIYYGEEIGMRGLKPDELIREPFLWESKNDTMRTQWMEPTYNTVDVISPLSVQMKDSGSIYHHYKSLIHFRRKSPVMTYGDVEQVDLANDELLAFTRSYAGDTVLVIHNLSSRVKRIRQLEPYSQMLFTTSKKVRQTEDVLALPPYQTIILSKPQK